MTRSRKKLCLALAVLFAVNVLIISLAQRADAVTYKQGSTGSVVTEIQQRLSDWGYYSGSVDGIYGSKTVAAVKYFQRTNGLTEDGKCGPAALAALGINASSASQSTSGDVELLARLISAEARGEPYTGQVAVGAVVLNRVESPAFPSTMSGVIYQSGAFTCLSDGQFWEEVADSAYQAAQDAINGWDPSGGALYYFNPNTATSSWIWSRPIVAVIGNHYFCT
ncbi:MAG: spore cortex-lytic enzyme [Oscillospiraceae bacterium]|nr:spore cortex-lytic enzyme [Oscillospiraceae bacterium]